MSALVIKSGTLRTPSSTGNQSYPHGLGETPKAMMFFGACPYHPSSDPINMGDSNSVFSFGMTDGSEFAAGGFLCQGSVGTSNTARHQKIDTDNCVVFLKWTTGTWLEGRWVSWDATNFTINWTTIQSYRPYVHWMALAGDDLEAALVNFTADTAGGTQNIAHGMSETPAAMIMAHYGLHSGVGASSSSNGVLFGLGYSDLTNNLAQSLVDYDGQGITDARSAVFTDRAVHINPDGGNPGYGTLSADGTNIVLDWDETPAHEWYLPTLCLAGIAAEAVDFTQKTSTGTQEITVSNVNDPIFGLFLSNTWTLEGDRQHCRIQIGFADDDGNEGVSWIGSEDNVTTSDCSRSAYNNACLKMMQENGSSPSTQASAYHSAFSSKKHSIYWTAADANARIILGLYLGLEGGGGGSIDLTPGDTFPAPEDGVSSRLIEMLRASPMDTFPAPEDEALLKMTGMLRASPGETFPAFSDSARLVFGIRRQVGDTFPAPQDSVATQLGQFLGSHFLILVDIYFDGGVYQTSLFPVRVTGSGQYYDGKVINMGPITRAIEVPSGLCRVSDGSLTIADVDQAMRQRLATDPARGKLIDIRLVPVGGSTLTAQRIYKGEITKVDLPEGAVTFHYTDRTFKFFNEEIPPLINANNFDDLPEGDYEEFAPIILGWCLSTLLGDQGSVACPQIDSANKEFCVARHEVESVEAVFRKEPDEEVFTEVSSGWSVSTEAKTIDGVAYTFTKIVFTSAQTDGVQIRADVKGLMVSGVAASLNLAQNVQLYLETFVQDTLDLDTARFQIVNDEFNDKGWEMSGAITDSMTHREAISQMVSSFCADFFQTKKGQIALALTPDEPATIAHYTDNFHLLKDGLVVHMPDPVCTKLHYKWGINPAGKYFLDDIAENETLASQMGLTVERTLEMPFCRDTDTALAVANVFMSWLSEESHRVDFGLDAPREVTSVELTDVNAISHYGGIGPSGWVEEAFKLAEVTFDPHNLAFRIHGVRANVPVTEAIEVLEGRAAGNARIGPYKVGRKLYVPLHTDTDLFMHRSTVYASGFEKVDTASFATNINSFDSCLDADNGKIHLAVSVATSHDVYYVSFDLASGQFSTPVLVASPRAATGTVHSYGSILGGGTDRVTIAVSSDDTIHICYGDQALYYDPADGTYELQAGSPGNYLFYKVKHAYSANGSSWTDVGIVCEGADSGRAVTSSQILGKLEAVEDKVYLVYAQSVGSTPSTPDFCVGQVWPTDSNAVRFIGGNLIFYASNCPISQLEYKAEISSLYVTFAGWAGAAYYMVIPVSAGGVISLTDTGLGIAPEITDYDAAGEPAKNGSPLTSQEQSSILTMFDPETEASLGLVYIATLYLGLYWDYPHRFSDEEDLFPVPSWESCDILDGVTFKSGGTTYAALLMGWNGTVAHPIGSAGNTMIFLRKWTEFYTDLDDAGFADFDTWFEAYA